MSRFLQQHLSSEPTSRRWRAWWLSALLALMAVMASIVAWWAMDSSTGVQWLQGRHQDVMAWHARDPWQFGVGLFVVFTLFSALALPGCSVLALAAGATLGLGWGTALVALASTAGATLSFLAARHWWRDSVRQRWGHRMQSLEDGLARDGALYLFVLRMVPLIPFPLLNPLMGLSAMPVMQFAVTSLLGMLLGSAAFVYAGTALGHTQIGALNWASPPLLVGLSVALVLPLVAGRWWAWRTQRA
jgi:uncharacterized membrane protein YdjX (TVP38/TMEM64 family)